jgi:hypothetical protein
VGCTRLPGSSGSLKRYARTSEGATRLRRVSDVADASPVASRRFPDARRTDDCVASTGTRGRRFGTSCFHAPNPGRIEGLVIGARNDVSRPAKTLHSCQALSQPRRRSSDRSGKSRLSPMSRFPGVWARIGHGPVSNRSPHASVYRESRGTATWLAPAAPLSGHRERRERRRPPGSFVSRASHEVPGSNGWSCPEKAN